jgi:alpha-glucosidase
MRNKIRCKVLALTLSLTFCFLPVSAVKIMGPDSTLTVLIEPGEQWWGGAVQDGYKMPFVPGYQLNLFGDTRGNQAQPLLVSNHGRYIWSEEPFAFQVYTDRLVLENVLPGKDPFKIGKAGNTLKDACSYTRKNFFPASGRMPDELMFSNPQYNTWIELVYNQNQDDVLKYARGIIENQLPAGVIMIDDNWQEDYGKWQFHPGRFGDPQGMIDSLHRMGFKVMVWICPFVSPDCDVYRSLRDEGLLIRDRATGEPAMIHWWNGVSAVLDLTHPGAMDWIEHQLSFLTDSMGIDGFKFDAGDSDFYIGNFECYKNISPNEHSELYGQLGLDYPLNEFRAMWKMGGQPLAERLRDKSHNWQDLHTLVPNLIVQGLMGYAFTCPDLIGGGEFSSFMHLASIDQDLIVRSTQCHALMPMMQFSVAPWRVLDKEHLGAVRKAIDIREQFSQLILSLVHAAAVNGEPVIRSMEYVFPGNGYEDIKDQFMLGDSIMVSPLLIPGTGTRKVIIPPGKWMADDGRPVKGPETITVQVPVERLPFFIKTR